MNREKLKAEEAEQDQRNKLIKSRPKKDDDPEREKKKKDAKMKNEALQEREQQKRADMTALAATQRKRNPNSTNVSFFQINKIQVLFVILEIIECAWWDEFECVATPAGHSRQNAWFALLSGVDILLLFYSLFC